MTRELELYDITTDPESLRQAILDLYSRMDEHNHDGVNSKTFQTAQAETVSARAMLIKKLSYTDTAAGLWMGLVGSAMKLNLGNATSFIKFDGSNLTIKAASSNLQLYDTVVDAAGNGDYTTVAAALTAGKTRIFVRNGTYSSESRWNLSTQYTQIIGESLGVVINFSDTSTDISVTANNCYIGNMRLNAPSSGNPNMILLTSAQQTTIEGCILSNPTGPCIIGGSYHSFNNVVFDSTGTTDFAAHQAINDCDYSTITNCLFNMTGIGTDLTSLISNCQYSRFETCVIVCSTSKTFGLTNSVTSTMVNSYLTGYGITANISMVGCMLLNNGSSPNEFVKIDTSRIRFCDNYVECPNDINATIFNIKAGQQSVVTGNVFVGGGKISLCQSDPPSANQRGWQFNFNTWRSVIGSATGTMALTIGTKGVSSNIIGNSILDNGTTPNTPTITDNGSSNNVAYNQLL